MTTVSTRFVAPMAKTTSPQTSGSLLSFSKPELLQEKQKSIKREGKIRIMGVTLERVGT